MATQLLVSTVGVPARSVPGEEWSHAGSIDAQRETELWRVVQGYLGLRPVSGRRMVEFYADLDPDSPGHADLLADRSARLPEAAGLADSRLTFWLALTSSVWPDRVLVAVQPAQLVAIRRRPPEPHPGLRTRRPVPVGVRLTAGSSGFFDVMPPVGRS